ncbi:hypothetical protein LGH83_08725 [Lichenihabitans sp. PAMC28606]|uniref:hypothetical protein n=1 Tax=Lichenihabitans sp. PAMC28606 TaxID=2880932 RepID=UPI001D09E94B|nr:hypothetical protein [Lichenihabitans sp. PAMC28606]UDL96244.1 hypothetical protein LGH83_08725 [Lichenihabitans sp. PAMC28606]
MKAIQTRPQQGLDGLTLVDLPDPGDPGPNASLAAHKALGSIMRARLQVYAALSAFHHRKNGVAAQEPSAIEQIPA